MEGQICVRPIRNVRKFLMNISFHNEVKRGVRGRAIKVMVRARARTRTRAMVRARARARAKDRAGI